MLTLPLLAAMQVQAAALPAVEGLWPGALALLAVATVASLLALRHARRRNRGLAARLDRARRVFDAARDVVFSLDGQGNIQSINKAIERLTGRPREEYLDTHFESLAVDEGERKLLATHLDKARQHRAEGTIRFRVSGQGGRRRILEAQVSATDEAGDGIHGMARDVTLRQQLEEGQLATERLEAVSQLSSGIAQDFNNLLTIIRSHAEHALEHLGQEDEEPRTDLATVVQAALRAELLTRQMMGYGRHLLSRPELFDLNEVVRATMRGLCPLLPEDIEYREELAARQSSVHADRAALEQIILNLCLNARDAMPEGGSLSVATADKDFAADTEIDAQVVHAGRYISLSVTDNGIGMDEATLHGIFDPFFTTKPPGRGAGLGLPTVQSAVARLGGHVFASSSPGLGSCLEVYLPGAEEVQGPPMARERSDETRSLLGEGPATGPTDEARPDDGAEHKTSLPASPADL